MTILVLFSLIWRQTTWIGGEGQSMWMDTSRYLQGDTDVQVKKGSITLPVLGFYPKIYLDSFPGCISVNDIVSFSADTIVLLTGGDYGRVLLSNDKGETFINLFEDGTFLKQVLNFTRGGGYFIATGNSNRYFWTKIDSINWGMQYIANQVINTTNLFYSPDYGDYGRFYLTTKVSYYWVEAFFYNESNVGSQFDDFVAPGADGNRTYAYGILTSQGRIIYARGRTNTGSLIYYKSSEISPNWINAGSTYNDGHIFKIIEDSSGVIYAITSGGFLYRSFSGGDTFPQKDSLGLYIRDIESGHSVTYLGTINSVYRTNDNGNSWDSVGSIPSSYKIKSIAELPDYRLWVGTYHPDSPAVFEGFYADSGYLVSSVFDTRSSDSGGTRWGRVLYQDSSFLGSQILVKVRTSPDSTMASAVPWNNCQPIENGDSLLNYSSVNSGDRYIQYRVELFSSDSTLRPFFYEISIEYEPDTIGPEILSAKIMDAQNQQNGFDADDYIEIALTEPIDSILAQGIDSSNIDSLFYITDTARLAPFDTLWFSPNIDTLYVRFGTFRPTLPQAGDSINAEPILIDIFGNSGVTTRVPITGTYNDIQAPKIISVFWTDGNNYDDEIASDDTLFFIFDEPMQNRALDPDSMDFYFPLFDYSWYLSGVVNIDTLKYISSDTLIVLFDTSGVPDYIPGDSGSGDILRDINNNTLTGIFYLTGTYDKKGPIIDEAILIDFPPYGPQPSTGDFFVLSLDEATNKPSIDSSNIDDILRLSGGHSWIPLDGNVGAYWNQPDRLVIEPIIDGFSPTVQEGDTLYPDSVTIKDRFGNPSFKPVVIQRFLEIEEEERSIKLMVEVPSIIKPSSFLFLSIPENTEVKIEVFDPTGRKRGVLLEGMLEKGNHRISDLFKILKRQGVFFIRIELKSNNGNLQKIWRKCIRIK